MSRRFGWAAVALVALAVGTRLPLQTQFLYHWDSVNFAFGLDHFAPQAGAPHYPGYIGYVALGQLLLPLFGTAQPTLVAISIASTALAAVVVYGLGSALFRPSVGLWAALFLLASPLVWFYSLTALPHTLDLLLMSAAVWLLFRLEQGRWRGLWWTVVFLGLLAGVRQQNLLFLAPLAVWAVRRLSPARLTGALVLGALVTLIWLVPLLAYSGGLASYLQGSSAYSAAFFTETSLLSGAGWGGLAHNLGKLIPYTLYAWGFAGLPVLAWLIKPFATLSDRKRGLSLLYSPSSDAVVSGPRNRLQILFVLWLAPVLLFYICIHMGQQGLVFVFLPALLLVSAAALVQRLEHRPRLLMTAGAGIVLANSLIFLALPAQPVPSLRLLTLATLRDHDAEWAATVAYVRDRYSPDDTAILSLDWRFVEYYLPEFALLPWDTDADIIGKAVSAADLGLNADAMWQVVVLEPDLRKLTDAALEPLGEMALLRLGPDDRFWFDGTRFGVR